MKKFFATLLLIAGTASAITIPEGFNRYGGNFPLDDTSVFEDYSIALDYVGAAPDNSSAYMGQVIAVPSNGVYFVDNNWNLQPIGGSFKIFTGENVDVMEELDTRVLFFKMDYNTNSYYTTFTNMSYHGTNYPTLLIPQRGQRGSDGSNLKFGGYWDPTKSYSSETIVSYEGNVYVSKRNVPSSEVDISNTNYWGLYVSKGDQGPRGDAGTIVVGTVTTGNAGTPAAITNSGTAENAILDFTIPKGDKGDPGVDLVYAGDWTNQLYPSNTVVRYGTNLWYTEVPNETTPSMSQTWKVFLSDGRQGNVGPRGETGATGEKGDPGNTFGIYAGAWDTSSSYTTNMWITWSGGTYGVIEDFTPETGTTPNTYVSSGKMVVLSLSGKDGTDGKNGAELTPYGDWNSSTKYPQYALVRYEDAQYYCKISESVGQRPTTFTNVWELFVKDGLNISDAYVTTNAFWAGKFELVNYVSNSIVYWDAPGYGTYYVLRDCSPEDYGTQVPQALNNTDYFAKIGYYGRDGAKGDPGTNGKDGVDGADGAGNMWFAGEWTSERSYPTNYIVAVSNALYGESLYVSIADSSNIQPGVTSGWQNYWELLVESGKNGQNGKDGENGGEYVFMMGWDPEYTYRRYDICVISNNFYLCNQASTGEEPWNYTSVWTKLISPDYRYYGLTTSREYSPTDIYVTNELVRYNGSTYVAISNNVSNIIPSSDTNVWAIFASKGDQGIQGNSGTMVVGTVTTGEAGSYASVTNRGTAENAILDFTIPRGDQGEPGVNLVYFGEWEATTNYPEESLVRYTTNLWYTVDGSSSGSTPGLSDDWEIYLMDGKSANVYVSTNTITVLPTEKAEVIVTPSPGGNDITLQFKIPQGVQGIQGEQGIQGIPGVDVVYYGEWQSGTNYPAESLVRYTTNLWYTVEGTDGTPGTSEDWQIFLTDGKPANVLVSTNTITVLPTEKAEVIPTYSEDGRTVTLQFKIPQGIQGIQGEQGTQGIPGMDLVYYGEWQTGTNYPEASLVRYTTNLWYSTETASGTPGTDTAWILFLADGANGADGKNGTNSTIAVTGTSTGLPGTDAIVTATTNAAGTHVDLQFTIPRGEKGEQGIQGIQGPKGDIGVEFKGEWSATTFPSNSLVRYGTNLWYTGTETTSSDIPGESQVWEKFLQDGDKGEQGIQGETGLTIYPVVTNTTTLDAGSHAYVSNSVVGTNSYFEFGIPKGEKGETGGVLVPKGNYSAEESYVQYDLVRYTNAQYYVYIETPSPITGIAPTNTDYWELFVKDGEGIAANATLIKEDETEYPGPLMLDTNTLVVTNIDDVAHLTVVGGGKEATLIKENETEFPGILMLDTNTLAVTNIDEVSHLTVVGGLADDISPQWELDVSGGIMPAIEVASGPWSYDSDGDMMPPIGQFSTNSNISNGDIPFVPTYIKSIETGYMNKGDSTNIPGVVLAVYDDKPYQETNSFNLKQSDSSYEIVAMEDWKGNATTLTIASDGDNFGTLNGEFDSKVVAEGAWMYLENVLFPLWITSISSTDVEWAGGYWTNNLAGNYSIEKVCPVKQDNGIGIGYGSVNMGDPILKSTSSSDGWYDIASFDGKIVYGVKQHGYIWKSVDGGENWTSLEGKNGMSARGWKGITVASDNRTVYAVVDGGYIWKSVDGGENWTSLEGKNGMSARNWCGITTIDGWTVYASANYAGIYKTIDGGENWNPCGEIFNTHYISCIDNNIIFAAAVNSKIKKSVDGGNTWTNLNSASLNWVGITAINEFKIYCTAYNGDGRIYRSIDAGKTWKITDTVCNDGNILFSKNNIFFNTKWNGGTYKKFILSNYSLSTNQSYTILYNFSPNKEVYTINDFATEHSGSSSYWSIETNPNLEWSIYGQPNSEWHVIAKRESTNDYWQVRTSSSLEPDSYTITSTLLPEEAISIALQTNAINRVTSEGYSSLTNYSEAFANQEIRLACTYYNTDTDNSPAVQSVELVDTVGGEFSMNNEGYKTTKIELSETNILMNVEKTDDVGSSALVFYMDNWKDGRGGGGGDGGGGGGWSPTSRTIIEQSATVTTNDYLIWMDGITNQTLTFPELNIDAMTVNVRQLSSGHSTEISLYNTTNTITLYDQGDSMTFDYLNGFGWFWR